MLVREDEEAVLLSDFEVLALLREHKQRPWPVSPGQDAQTVEYETLAHLSDPKLSAVASAGMTTDKFATLMGYLATLKLTKLERLQLVNHLPTTFLDFYVLVEECEERFTQEQVEQEILPHFRL